MQILHTNRFIIRSCTPDHSTHCVVLAYSPPPCPLVAVHSRQDETECIACVYERAAMFA